jgi:dienelactone hydrolase
VGLRTVRFVDRSRRITLPGGGVEPRTLVTYVRFPVSEPAPGHGSTAPAPGPGSPAAASKVAPGGPFPLVVFGHGFALTPTPYAGLLDAWTRAGYVVAAPVFPLGNANSPGGPNESDLNQQPRDVRFVITRLLAASAAPTGALHHLIDPTRIAVAGHSDGGDTALAVAYDRYFRDPRVKATVILSGAEIPGLGGFTFPPGSPPLLATQGTADAINPPAATHSFYDAARRPKYLLTLLGASHLTPYSGQTPQSLIVKRVTIAFLDRYLKGRAPVATSLASLGRVPGISELRARP